MKSVTPKSTKRLRYALLGIIAMLGCSQQEQEFGTNIVSQATSTDGFEAYALLTTFADESQRTEIHVESPGGSCRFSAGYSQQAVDAISLNWHQKHLIIAIPDNANFARLGDSANMPCAGIGQITFDFQVAPATPAAAIVLKEN